ncbi:hypothetical protein BCR44DRAFT_47477 [Catenaria anguillulae PL171]|uniref:Uncharacterized protein n=1 Tax=Catenaria anguillulae PL171 TaxID=765915 RepID=A0A1Y2HX24_9FUNG|nr:hypothetical protein BCR44DRAFT_47477 [Catenaria anguillulae PL171]
MTRIIKQESTRAADLLPIDIELLHLVLALVTPTPELPLTSMQFMALAQTTGFLSRACSVRGATASSSMTRLTAALSLWPSFSRCVFRKTPVTICRADCATALPSTNPRSDDFFTPAYVDYLWGPDGLFKSAAASMSLPLDWVLKSSGFRWWRPLSDRLVIPVYFLRFGHLDLFASHLVILKKYYPQLSNHNGAVRSFTAQVNGALVADLCAVILQCREPHRSLDMLGWLQSEGLAIQIFPLAPATALPRIFLTILDEVDGLQLATVSGTPRIC